MGALRKFPAELFGFCFSWCQEVRPQRGFRITVSVITHPCMRFFERNSYASRRMVRFLDFHSGYPCISARPMGDSSPSNWNRRVVALSIAYGVGFSSHFQYDAVTDLTNERK